MSHTPGPWRVGKYYAAVVTDARPEGRRYDEGDLEAYGGYLIAESILLCDRALIAAAPELLEAAEWAVEWLNRLACPDFQGMNGLEAAIAKASGLEGGEPETEGTDG